MANEKKIFVYIWEYIVKEECLSEFEKIYGSKGDWIQFFRKAKGYIRTDLYHDIPNKKRFITVDFWNTKEDRDHFQMEFSNAFENLDKHCDNLTKQEKLIGNFDTLGDLFSRTK